MKGDFLFWGGMLISFLIGFNYGITPWTLLTVLALGIFSAFLSNLFEN